MSGYNMIFKVCTIIFICFLLYLFYKFIILLVKKNRLDYFSLNDDLKENDSYSRLMKFIFGISTILEEMAIFNGIGRMYDRYIYEDSRIRKGLDYISIKLLLGTVFIILYLFLLMLNGFDFSGLVISVCFILGFIIPDLYCFYVRSKKGKLLNKNILPAIIIMNNSYKANRSTEQAIMDVIERSDGLVKYEFKKALNDIKLGISVSDAFRRMYDRTKLNIVLDMSRILALVNKCNTNIVKSFEVMEKRLLDEEKFINDLNILKEVNKIAYIMFIIIPFVFMIGVIGFNHSYMSLILSSNGIYIVLILLIIYILYLFILHRMVRGKY